MAANMVKMIKKFCREFSEAWLLLCSLQFWKMAVFWILSLLISYSKLFIPALFGRKREFYPRCPTPPMPPSTSPRPVCIVTGASSGLGEAAALALSKEGFCVVLAGRSPPLLSKAIIGIKVQNKDAHLKAFHVDLSSFPSMLTFVESLRQWLSDSNMHQSIQLLINNAGILATSSRLTVDGYDQMMETNYLGAFFLTKLLLPLLRNSPLPSRIVNVTSFTHRAVFSVQIDKEIVAGTCYSKARDYPFAHIYEFSKLCLVLFSYKLHRQLVSIDKSAQISVNAADPGAVDTRIMRELPSCLSSMASMTLKLLGLLQLPENGINSILDAALAPVGLSGRYFFGGKGRSIDSSALSHNARLMQNLWETSSNMFSEERERS